MSGRINCRSHFLNGKIGKDKPLYYMDTYSIGTSYLAVGGIPRLYYHHCRSRRFFLWQVQT